MTGIDVRVATEADAAGLASVYHSAYRENRRLGFPAKAESVTEAEVHAWIREHTVFVATNEDDQSERDVVGGVRLEGTSDDVVKCSRLAVHEEYKGTGIGSRLLDCAETEVLERGEDTIRLTTPAEHPFLPDWYASRGYEVVGPYPLEYRDYDEVVMEKRLESGGAEPAVDTASSPDHRTTPRSGRSDRQ